MKRCACGFIELFGEGHTYQDAGDRVHSVTGCKMLCDEHKTAKELLDERECLKTMTFAFRYGATASSCWSEDMAKLCKRMDEIDGELMRRAYWKGEPNG